MYWEGNVTYVRKSSASLIRVYAGTNVRIIIRIILMIFVCEMASQNVLCIPFV